MFKLNDTLSVVKSRSLSQS